MAKRIINLALMAHADAGKTTITEHFLYKGGLSKQVGSVDEGTTHSDFLQVERDRGISVRASFNSFDWKGTCVNLIDTPGHIDFTAELERILPVIDAAILVISAVEGIQAQTEAIWEALQERNIPVLFFVNKVDRIGSDVEAVVEDIKKEFTTDIIRFQHISNEGLTSVEIASSSKYEEEYEELIAGLDEALLERYLENGVLSQKELEQGLKAGFNERTLFPVLVGASKLDLGVDELLDFVEEYFPKAPYHPEDAVSAYVYAVGKDKTLGKTVYLRMFGGVLKARDLLVNNRLGEEEKVSLIKKGYGLRFDTVDAIESGDIAMVTGLKNAKVGDVLGTHSVRIPKQISIHEPLLDL